MYVYFTMKSCMYTFYDQDLITTRIFILYKVYTKVYESENTSIVKCTQRLLKSFLPKSLPKHTKKDQLTQHQNQKPHTQKTSKHIWNWNNQGKNQQKAY